MQNITQKTYRRLSLLVSLRGLSFCCFDTISSKPIFYKELKIKPIHPNQPLENILEEVFNENPELHSKYDEVTVLHHNSLNTFVPISLFDEDFLGSYLQYNTKVFETDFFTFDEMPMYDMNNVYIPYVHVNNFFIDKYGSFEYKHASTILVDRLLKFSKNRFDKTMFVHVQEKHLDIVVIENQRVILYNTFEYKTPEDFIYFILFTAEQLQLNPEEFDLEFLGKIKETDATYAITYKYVRNVTFMEVPTLNYALGEEEHREHYILLHS